MAGIVDLSPISIMPHYAPLSADAAQIAAARRTAASTSYGARYGAAAARGAAQTQIAYQTKLAGCRTQCAPRPVLWQQHCRDLCMQGKVMPCIANEPWPPCVAARSIKGTGELPAPLGVPIWGWALGVVGVGALVFMTSARSGKRKRLGRYWRR